MSSRPTDFSAPTLADRLAPWVPAEPARHVWALVDESWEPGLLLAWRKQADGWWGKVVVVSAGEPKVFMLVAARLRPVEAKPPSVG